jgi:probable F420-dependent oxidoreductase
MKFGVNIPNFGHRTTPEEMAGWASHAENSGFHLLMVSDHVALTPDVARLFPPPFYDPFNTLAWLAGLTTTIELGTTVIVLPYRHPLLTARAAADIDQFSGGRMILGVSAGWSRSEFEALGIDYGSRGRLTNDYLAAIKELWANEVASVHNSSVSFGPVASSTRPVRQGHLPVWVGGHSPASMQRAVSLGDAWHPTSMTISYLSDIAIPTLRQLADRSSRPMPAFAPRIKLSLSDRPRPSSGRLAGEGNMEQIREDLAVLDALGASYVLFDTSYPGQTHRQPAQHYWDMLDQVAAELVDLPGQRLR